jgi:hypothetical protein
MDGSLDRALIMRSCRVRTTQWTASRRASALRGQGVATNAGEPRSDPSRAAIEAEEKPGYGTEVRRRTFSTAAEHRGDGPAAASGEARPTEVIGLAYRSRFPTTLVCRSGSGSTTLTDDALSAGPCFRGCKTGASGSSGNGPSCHPLLYCVPP